MSLLTKVTTGKKGRAQKGVVYGPEGFGKSTLAGQFPNPLFLDVEDSTSQLDVRRLSRSDLPDLKTFESALEEIAKVRPCSTLVVDTIDWLEQMVLDAIVAEANNPKIKGIEDFGYGKGYTILRERVTILLNRFDDVIAAGIHVVLLAHSKVVKFEPPDGAGPYDRYELKLSKQVAPLVKEWADFVVFGNWRTQVKERDKNEPGAQFKGVGGRERLLYCNRTAAWDAKNRHGLDDQEKWEIATIEKAFRAVFAPWGDAPAATPAKPATDAARIAKIEEKRLPEPASTEPAPAAEPDATIAKLSAEADAIPGVANLPAVLPEFANAVEPHAADVEAWMLSRGEITQGQTWRHASETLQKRVAKNPAGFLKVALAGKAVAA